MVWCLMEQFIFFDLVREWLEKAKEEFEEKWRNPSPVSFPANLFEAVYRFAYTNCLISLCRKHIEFWTWLGKKIK